VDPIGTDGPSPRALVPVGPAFVPRKRRGARRWAAQTAVVFAVVVVVVGIPRDLHGTLIASDDEAPIQVAFLALVVLGAAVAGRWPGAGSLILGLAGAVLARLAALQYPEAVAVPVGIAFLAPAAAMWVVWQHARSRPTAVVLMAAVFLMLGTGWVGTGRVVAHFVGPTHPASPLRPLPRDQVDWAWVGGVTAGDATVVARVVARGDAPPRRARLLVRTRDAAGAEVASPAQAVPGDGVVRLAVTGLRPATPYEWAVEVDGRRDATRGTGRFTTFSEPGRPASFTVAVSSCAGTGSSGAVFDAIRAAAPSLYLLTGDAHYGNLESSSPGDFVTVLGRVLRAPSQAALYREVPVAYVWDDHDYGANDADAGSPSREAARAAYRRVVPHYPLPGGNGAIHQAFTVGRVRFVVTDTRSERTSTTMLGAAQLAWLEEELRTGSRTHALVVWVNPDPWIGADDPGADTWAGYPEERRRIADLVTREGIRNLVMLSGDAHMVAIDDGTHSPGGFPVLQAGALDRRGNAKGGPYSHGALTGGGRFGTLQVTDDGDGPVDVELAAWHWTGARLLSHRFTVPAAGRP
jgi:hypothetical protein